jgi:hypothetical protein
MPFVLLWWAPFLIAAMHSVHPPARGNRSASFKPCLQRWRAVSPPFASWPARPMPWPLLNATPPSEQRCRHGSACLAADTGPCRRHVQQGTESESARATCRRTIVDLQSRSVGRRSWPTPAFAVSDRTGRPAGGWDGRSVTDRSGPEDQNGAAAFLNRAVTLPLSDELSGSRTLTGRPGPRSDSFQSDPDPIWLRCLFEEVAPDSVVRHGAIVGVINAESFPRGINPLRAIPNIPATRSHSAFGFGGMLRN